MDILVIRIGAKEISTEEFLKKLKQIYSNYSVEMIEINTMEPIEVVGWWIGAKNKTPLITIRDTIVYRDIARKSMLRKLFKNDTSLEYYGQIETFNDIEMAKVYSNPEYWVIANDVRPKG